MELDADLRERLQKYPAWINDVIRKLQSDLSVERTAVGLLQEEVDRLVEWTADNAPRIDANTILMSDSDSVPDTPLGDNVTIRFGDFYQVTYDDRIGLMLDTDGPMAIYPGNFSGSIRVTKA